MKSVIRKLFTEPDNTTPDIFKVLAVIIISVGIWLTVYSVVWKGTPFDMQTFGLGIGSLFAGLGISLGFKKETPID